MSLKKQAVKGGVWASSTRMGINLIDFSVYAYLARILTLEDFGLVGLCLLFIEIANMVVNSGINQNLVQREKWDDSYASSTLIFTSGLGLISASCLVFIAAPIAYFYLSATAAYVIASLAPITILMSLQVVYSGKLLRDFKNKQMGIVRFAATVLSGILTVVLAELDFGLWSIVYGRLLNALFVLVLFAFYSKFKPTMHFSKKDNRELIKFCMPLLGSSVLNVTHQKVASIFTGLVLGPASFALLTAARKGQQMLTDITVSSVNSMVVPSFSRVKDKNTIGDHYIKLVALTATLLLPLFVGLAGIADPFVTLVFGDKFTDSATYMEISAFSMFPALISWFLPTLLISQGQTGEAFKLNLISVLSSVLVAGATIWFGVTPMLISMVIINIVVLPLRMKIVLKYIPIDIKKFVTEIYPSYVCALGMYFCLIESKALMSTITNDIIVLIILIVVGAGSYILLSFLLFYKRTINLLNEMKKLLSVKVKLKNETRKF
tara:strand:+ start:1359 stop:2834 length:1476 start_codon:yes stop_codon:yes gene_type:complete